MTHTSTEQLLSAVLALPDHERVEFVEAIIESLESPDKPPFDASWRAVIKRRSAELRSGQCTTIPWAEVKRQGREAAGA